MAIIWRKLSKLNTKKALSAVLLAGLAALTLSYFPARAQGPQFNIFPITFQAGELNRDLPLLDGRNATPGKAEGWSISQADHDAGVQASTGDILEFSIYYHNGAVNADANVAINTVIQTFSSAGLSTPALTHTLSAAIGAQNASTVSSSDFGRGGNINVHIQGGTPLSLSLVPGSVVLLRDQGLSPKPGPQTLSDTIFGGANIGNVRGCFEFHGFVNFKLQVSQVLQGNLQIQKQVRNIIDTTALNQTEVSADPGDLVEYQILVNATSNPVSNVSVRDALDTRITPTGTVTLNTIPISTGAFFSASGVNIGTVNPGTAAEIRFQATVSSAPQFTVGVSHILTNTATAFTSTQAVSDGANARVLVQVVQVSCNFTWDPPHVADGSLRGLRRVGEQPRVRLQVSGLPANASFTIVDQHVAGSPVITSPQTANAAGSFDVFDTTVISSSFTPGDYNVFIQLNNVNVATCRGFRIEPQTVHQIDLDKTVRNDTTITGFADQVDAASGQRLTFRITINPGSSNTTLQNLVVRDTLPSKLTFVTGSLNIDGIFVSEGGFFTFGNNIGNLSPGQTRVITFQADVASASNFAVGCEVLTNTARVDASGNLTDSDTATVRVCKTAPTKQPGAPGPRPL